MALKTEVIDRVPTYPGRVKMTPVSGQQDVYDLSRADDPITEGTPINKALFDQKAYTLTGNATVYVSQSSGSDAAGTGSASAPYASIQKALDSLPKCLGGYHAQIDIAAGTYEERVTIDGFYGGRLTLGVSDRQVTVRGISVMSSDGVRINISHITYAAAFSGTLLYADYGSNVSILTAMTLRGENGGVNGIAAARGSTIVSGVTVACLNFNSTCVYATSGSRINLATINGNDMNNANTSYGIRADLGGVVSYASKGLSASAGDITASGGRILAGSGTTMANASKEE